MLREKSPRSQVETRGYLGPEAMNLIKADVIAFFDWVIYFSGIEL